MAMHVDSSICVQRKQMCKQWVCARGNDRESGMESAPVWQWDSSSIRIVFICSQNFVCADVCKAYPNGIKKIKNNFHIVCFVHQPWCTICFGRCFLFFASLMDFWQLQIQANNEANENVFFFLLGKCFYCKSTSRHCNSKLQALCKCGVHVTPRCRWIIRHCLHSVRTPFSPH